MRKDEGREKRPMKDCVSNWRGKRWRVRHWGLQSWTQLASHVKKPECQSKDSAETARGGGFKAKGSQPVGLRPFGG